MAENSLFKRLSSRPFAPADDKVRLDRFRRLPTNTLEYRLEQHRQKLFKLQEWYPNLDPLSHPQTGKLRATRRTVELIEQVLNERESVGSGATSKRKTIPESAAQKDHAAANMPNPTELHGSEGESTRVFVQYAHENEDHKRSVRTLADRLRGDGIEAVVDQYVENPPEGWPSWMTRQLREAKSVLVVCSRANDRRLSKQEEAGKGLGAIWEGHLLQQYLYEGAAHNDRFLPVLLTRDDEQFIPIVLRANTWYGLYETDGYERLFARLTGRVPQPPPVGPIRAMAPDAKKSVDELP